MKNNFIKIEIVAFAVLIILLLVYFCPKIMKNIEKTQNKTIKTNCELYTKSVLSDFSKIDKKNADYEKIAKEIINNLNQVNKNPVTKKEAYVFGGKCEGCINIEVDKKVKSITATGYDKNSKIVARTVIQPPSYVTYEREEK